MRDTGLAHPIQTNLLGECPSPQSLMVGVFSVSSTFTMEASPQFCRLVEIDDSKRRAFLQKTVGRGVLQYLSERAVVPTPRSVLRKVLVSQQDKSKRRICAALPSARNYSSREGLGVQRGVNREPTADGGAPRCAPRAHPLGAVLRESCEGRRPPGAIESAFRAPQRLVASRRLAIM